MAKGISDNQHYIDIAAAIRTKNKTETVYKPSEMAPAILEIQGGGELNFEIVGGTTQPSNPKPNTIWVNTGTEITEWSFSATEPTNPVNGMVWIVSTLTSKIVLNALTKNELYVYPNRVYQYISGVWESAESRVYIGNEWKDFLMLLYKAGNEYAELTGGWNIVGQGEKQSNQILVGTLSDASQHTSYATHSTPVLINDDINTLKVHFVKAVNANTSQGKVEVRVTDETGKDVITKIVINTSGTVFSDYTENVDVSGLSGNYYVYVVARHSGGGARTVYAIFDEVGFE